jgi:hypothetical protein
MLVPLKQTQGATPPPEGKHVPTFLVRHRRLLSLMAVIAALIGVYAAAGFLGVPYLLRTNLQSFVREHYGRALQVREVRFNPFSLTLEAYGVALPDADGKPMLGFERLHVQPALASVWRFAPSFREILLEKPSVHAVVGANGELNLADLGKGFGRLPAQRGQQAGAPMKLFIERLQVTAGTGELEDRTIPGTFHEELKPVNFELRDFSTRSGTNSLYELTAASPGGTRLKWSGTLQLQPLISRGSFELQNLPIRTLWIYLRSPLPIAKPPGAIAIHGQYDAVYAGGALGLKVDVPDITVTALKVRPEHTSVDYIDLPKIEVQGTHVDLAQQSVQVTKVLATGGAVSSWRNADGNLNLLELMSMAASTPGAASGSTPPQAGSTASRALGTSATPAAASSSKWRVSAPDIELHQLKVTAEDRQVTPAVRFTLDPFDVHVAGYSTAPDATLNIELDSAVNGAGKLHATARMSPGSGAATAKLEARGLDLEVLQPYIAQQTGMTLLSGQLASRLGIERKAGGSFGVKGEVRVTDLRTVDDEAREDFIRWKDLRINDIQLASEPASLRIGSIVARQPYARVIIFPNLTTNITEILTPKARLAGIGNAPLDSGKASAPDTKTAASNVQAGERESTSPPPREIRQGKKGKVTAVVRGPSAPLTPIPVSIRNVQIIDGSANYADYWIQPNFAVGIQALNGTVAGVSSDPSSRAQVQLDGKVERYAPARISGEVNLLSATTYSDIKLSFKGVDMTSVTPYSGRFAGYKIDKGKLSVDLSYKVENRQLTAEQRFVIDQLQLGERVESKDAVKLPLKLAIALLKDRNGVIDIGLPMKGSLDDPQFSLGPLVWKAVVNLLDKVVTAPFAALGHLFGGGEQMNIIEFAPGSAELDAAAKDRLGGLIKALQERPQLRLDVPAAFSPDLDRPSLQAARLHEQLVQSAQGKNKAAAAGPPEDGILANPDEHFRLALAAYRSEMKGAELPASVQTAKEAKGKDPTALVPAIRDLEGPLIVRIQVPEADLQQLGVRRAQAVEDALVAGGVDPARIFVINEQQKPGEDTGEKAEKGGDKVRIEMSLK